MLAKIFYLSLILSSCGYQTHSNTQDAVTIGAKGDVALFYKKDSLIYKRICEDHTIITNRTECKGSESYYKIEDFKKILFTQLNPRAFDGLDEKFINIIKNYNTSINTDPQSAVANLAVLKENLLKLQSQLNILDVEIKKIEKFIEIFGIENADITKLQQLNSEAQNINLEINKISPDIERITSFLEFLQNSKSTMEGLMTKLIDQAISTDKIHVFAKNRSPEDAFFYELLYDMNLIPLGTSTKKIVDLEAGHSTTCATIAEGNKKSIRCWGGSEKITQSAIQNYQFVNPKLIAMSSIDFFACISDDTGVQCFEKDRVFKNPIKNIKELVATNSGYCALTDTELSCFKYTSEKINKPEWSALQTISGGWNTICGSNSSGTMCEGESKYRSDKIAKTLKTSPALDYSCMIDLNGEVSCLGNPSVFSPTSYLYRIPSAKNAISISTGVSMACLQDSRDIKCWGVTSKNAPTVPTLNNPRSLTTGAFHSCAIDDSGIKCWGENSKGQLDIPSDLTKMDNRI